MKREYTYLFGPVPSRRLGRSLGVDLTPFKTCTLDCIFCQLGHTTHKTVDRAEYVPVAKVRAELVRWLNAGGKADHITLSGSGEPTLHTRFGDVLQSIRDLSAIPSVLLSNGTLFGNPDVRKAAQKASIVKMTLSAWDAASFERIHRPHPGIRFDQVLAGQRAFREEYQGQLWIEVFLIPGIHTAGHDVDAIARLVESIRPDEIHLNTAVRPPAEAFVHVTPAKTMNEFAAAFHPAAKVMAEFPSHMSADIAVTEETILAMIERRPCTAQHIARVFGLHLNEVSKHTGKLLRTGKIRTRQVDDETYYVAVAPQGEMSAYTAHTRSE